MQLKHKNTAPLLLGTVGWERRDWLAGYYPDDLPEDWRLAYYANDCNCLMLTAGQLPLAMRRGLPDGLDEAGGELTCVLDLAAAGPATRPLVDDLARLVPGSLVLLSDTPLVMPQGVPVWHCAAPGQWAAPGGTARAVCWHLDVFDLRALRERAAGLPADTRLLVIDGPAATPARIGELRILLELLGRG